MTEPVSIDLSQPPASAWRGEDVEHVDCPRCGPFDGVPVVDPEFVVCPSCGARSPLEVPTEPSELPPIGAA